MSESEKQQEACSVGGSNRGVEEECSENVLRVTRGAPREPLPNWVDITEELFRATGGVYVPATLRTFCVRIGVYIYVCMCRCLCL